MIKRWDKKVIDISISSGMAAPTLVAAAQDCFEGSTSTLVDCKQWFHFEKDITNDILHQVTGVQLRIGNISLPQNHAYS